MGAGRPGWSAITKNTRLTVAGSWLMRVGIWTAALGVALYLNLHAAGHRNRQAAVQAAAAIERNERQALPGQEREGHRRIFLLHFFMWLAGAGFLGVRTIREQSLWRRLQQTADELERERSLREQLDECPDGLCIIRENIIRYANRQLAFMVGISFPEITASPLTSLLPADELVRFSRQVGRLADAGGEARFDSALLRRGGARLEVEVHARNVIFAGQEAHFLALREIGARKQREEATEATGAFLQSILDGMAEAVTVFDADYRLLAMNKTARQLYGEDLSATHLPFCYQLMHGEENRCSGKDHVCPVQRVVECKKPCLVMHNHRGKDGGETPMEIMASPIFNQTGEITGIIEVGRDISHRLKGEKGRKRTVEGLCRREKEEAVATLVGGLAHEYNNILAVILGNSELLRLNMVPAAEKPEMIENICHAAKRMAEMNRQLLASAKLSPKHLRPLSLNPLVQEVLQLQRPPAVRLLPDLAADLWPVLADAEQMRQLFGNLLANAFEALGGNGGQVGIVTKNARMAKVFSHGDRQLPAGDYVRITISDSGPGIESGMCKKIFDPFFSTKFLGRGLGLAVAKGIAESHGGAIIVVDGQDRGGNFEILLPRAPRDAEGMGAAAGRRPAILVIEDDPEIVRVLKETLNGAGYRKVLVAGTGERGLELLAEKGQELKLLILDIRLPGISGREVYRRVRAEAAGIRVLAASGTSREEALSGLSLHPRDAFLQKPFAPAALLGEVERLLD